MYFKSKSILILSLTQIYKPVPMSSSIDFSHT